RPGRTRETARDRRGTACGGARGTGGGGMARRGLVEVRRGAGRPQLPPGGYGYVPAVREQQRVRCAAISQGPRQLAPVDRVRPGHPGGGGSELAVRTISCGPVRRLL